MITDKETELPLPFTHGIEIELQVIHKDGTWLQGDEVLEVFDRIISNAKNLLERRIRKSNVETVIEKYSHSKQTEEGDRGSRIVAIYKNPVGELEEYTLLGHDPNVTSLTWILEVATPPCTSLQELAWWVQALIAISYEAIPTESNAILISTGLNPTQEYLKNLSFGEHHHILGPNVDDSLRLAVYNMIRNFMPHLIAISVNSPFENKKTTDELYVDETGRTRAPRCKRSIRLLRNTTQMGPSNEFELIPYQERNDAESFAEHVKRSPPRMVDIYPFTDYQTVEVRVFDTQLSVPRRMGIAFLLQALAMKAKAMLEKGMKIPDVGAHVLAANRDAAIDAGLWGPFKGTKNNENQVFSQIYNNKIDNEGQVQNQGNRYLADAVNSMLFFIREELEDLQAFDDPFMQPLFSSVFGTNSIEERTTSADYQLQVYAKSGMNMMTLLQKLTEITRECSTNWVYDPMTGRANIPKWMKWWTGIEITIEESTSSVIAGDPATFMIEVSNNAGKDLTDVPFKYQIEDSSRRVIKRGSELLSSLKAGEIYTNMVEFSTEEGVTAYNILISLPVAGRELKATKTLHTIWLTASLRAGATTQFADGRTPLQFTGGIETNQTEMHSISSEISVVLPRKGQVLVSKKTNLMFEDDSTIIFNQDDFPKIIIQPNVASDVQRCILGLSIWNDENRLLAQSKSRPFYLGFVERGPEIELTTSLGRYLHHNEVVHGNVQLRPRGHSISSDAKVILEFQDNLGNAEQIAALSRKELLTGPLGFEWRFLNAGDQTERGSGQIVARLIERGIETAKSVTPKSKISVSEIKTSIDSIRVPDNIQIGDNLSGWLRVRRNTIEGENSILVLSIQYPEQKEKVVLRQPLMQKKHLSVSFGPIRIPKPRSGRNPDHLILKANLVYSGQTVDQRRVNIQLDESERKGLDIEYSGIPRFVDPDSSISAVIQLKNELSDSLNGNLRVSMSIKDWEKELFDRKVTIGSNEMNAYPIPFRIPLFGGMSTLQIKATIRFDGKNLTNQHSLKIKPLDTHFFELAYRILDSSGKEIPGLVSRNKEIGIEIVGKSKSEKKDVFSVRLRVLSRGETIQIFEVPMDIDASGGFKLIVPWKTPDVDTVTPFYLEAEILEGGVPIPHRGLRQKEKHFTVY